MKKLLLIITIALSVITEAQVKSVFLKASGLTCSMCSNAINKALKSLDFVLEVESDIKTYTFEITFKPNSIIDFDMIKKKVIGAGFSVSAFVANIHFNNVQVKNNQSVTVDNKTFVFVNAEEQVLNGDKQVKIIDKGFISPKEYKTGNFSELAPQTYHVSL